MLAGVLEEVARAQGAAHVAEYAVAEDAPAGADLLLEGGELGVGEVLAAVLPGQLDAVEAQFAAAAPDRFEVGAGEQAAGGEAALSFVLGEFTVEVVAQAVDEFGGGWS